MSAGDGLNGKRLIIVLGGLELGGAERQAYNLARWLVQSGGAQVQVWGFSPPGGATRLFDEAGIPWRSLPFPWSRGWTNKLRHLLGFTQTLRQARPDVLLPFTVLPNILCGLTWRLSGARTCVWNQRLLGEREYSPRTQRLAALLTPRFISNSTHGAEYLHQFLGVPPERIRVIFNSIDLPPPATDRAGWRQRLGIGPQTFLACMVANLRGQKDHATLLRAWRLVGESDPQATLLLAGQFLETYPALTALAQELELGERVRFLGQVQDVSGLLGAVDLGVFASWAEGLPNGVLEPMAAGLPLAAVDIPGVREALGANGGALLSPMGAPEPLAANILRLRADPALRQQMGAQNQERIRAQFDLQQVCAQSAEWIAGGLR